MAQSKLPTLEGNEQTDGYVRTHVPQGRWADAWDLFKRNLGKFFLINILTLLFFAPGIAIVFYRMIYIAQLGVIYPFSSNVLFTYPFTPDMTGIGESLILSADLVFYSLLIVAGMIASVGLAGASYSIRKMINTHGQFKFKDYFRGIKVCYFKVFLPVTMFMAFVFASLVVADWVNQQIAYGYSAGGPITAEVFIIIATVLVGIIACWLLAVGVSFKVNLKDLFKNSFVFLFSTIVQSVFMLGFALIPVWLLLIGTKVTFILVLAAIIFFFMGFPFILLSWFAYTQWVFDAFITPAVKAEKEAKRAKMTPQQLEAERQEEEKAVARELLAAGRSELIGRPLKPIEEGDRVREIGEAFGRDDILNAAADRQTLVAGVNEYYEQHKKDTRYVEYEKLFAEREKALQAPSGKKGKDKRVSSDNLLR